MTANDAYLEKHKTTEVMNRDRIFVSLTIHKPRNPRTGTQQIRELLFAHLVDRFLPSDLNFQGRRQMRYER